MRGKGCFPGGERGSSESCAHGGCRATGSEGKLAGQEVDTDYLPLGWCAAPSVYPVKGEPLPGVRKHSEGLAHPLQLDQHFTVAEIPKMPLLALPTPLLCVLPEQVADITLLSYSLSMNKHLPGLHHEQMPKC